MVTDSLHRYRHRRMAGNYHKTGTGSPRRPSGQWFMLQRARLFVALILMTYLTDVLPCRGALALAAAPFPEGWTVNKNQNHQVTVSWFI